MAAEKLTRARLIQLIVVLIIFLALVAWRTWSFYETRAQQQTDMTNGSAPSASTLCNLNQQICALESKDGAAVTLELSPLPPQAESELQLRVSGLPATVVPQGTVEGRDMYMGVIPLVFTRQGDDWIASFQVGSCTSDKMVWLVNVVAAGGSYPVLFDVAK